MHALMNAHIMYAIMGNGVTMAGPISQHDDSQIVGVLRHQLLGSWLSLTNEAIYLLRSLAFSATQ
jgi:hypothetical protein